MADFTWERGARDFAVREDLDSVRGIFQRGVTVEAGCKALLLVDGALASVLDAGGYDEGGIAARLKNFDLGRSATAIIVDAGDVELTFTVAPVMTNDPMMIDVDCTLVLQVDDPVLFFTNVMKGRKRLTLDELEQRFAIEVQNALQQAVGQRSVEELNTDLSLKQQFELLVDEHLRRTFQRGGFGFVQFRTVTYRYRGLDQVRGIREDGFLQLTEDQARLTNRKRLFDVYDRDQLQQIYEDTRKGERDIKAQGERARIARELNPLLMDEVKSTEQLDQFLLEVEKGKLLRAEEIRAFRQTLQEKKDDADLARVSLLRRVDLEREFQYEEMRLLGRGDIELKLARQGKEIRLAQVEIELKEDEEVRSHAREQAMRDHQAGLEREMATATTDLRKRQIAAEIQKIGMEMYRLHKETTLALRVKKQLELNVAKLRVRDERMRQDVAAKRETVKIEEDAKDRRAERRLRMIREMAGASVEALIAVSPDKQAQMLADLKRLDVAKSLTEEQLLALAAEKNPSLVTAFEKKFEGMSRADLERLYERWMQDKDQTRTEQTEAMERMFNRALETQRDVGVAAAGAGRQTIVTGAGGGPGSWPAGGPTIIGGPTVVSPGVGGATGVFRCTYCGAELRTGDRFCGGCGKAVAGDRGDPAPPPA